MTVETPDSVRHALNRIPAYIQLESGHIFHGYSIGANLSTQGEAVFQTGMVGYVESLTDPSYASQLLVLTYPIIGNYGVPDMTKRDDADILLNAESNKIHPAALIISDYSSQYSHWNATSSLSEWLISQKVPAIAGVDTRELTKLIRESGTMNARLVISSAPPSDLIFSDPSTRNLVAEVSSTSIYHIQGSSTLSDAPTIIVIDCGIKFNQLRELRKRCRRLIVVPWDADISTLDSDSDAIFISNGPGDPALTGKTITQLKTAMERRPHRPIFGICLGHQLLARAAGFDTYKLKYGNRGHNQPCVDLSTGRCHITSQNHGYAVETNNVPKHWTPTFVNANDNTNEGIAHKTLPFFSVQFHPEACAGPNDTAFLFDRFIKAASTCRAGGKPSPLFDFSAVSKRWRGGLNFSVFHDPPSIPVISKVIVLGSGGLSIGQAGEFDYSGSQAIKALRAHNVRTVLINPNIATVQTSPGLADKVYYLPVTPDNVLKVAENERPDGILMTFGGQTALNCGVELYKSGDLDRLNIKVLGTTVETILDTEDRDRFNRKLSEINEPYANSKACETVDECVNAAERIGYPVILRAAFALGGLGSGFADNADMLSALAAKAFSRSSQVLVEKSMKGWKEIEYEVVRDAYDNCITVCNMENFDPLGIHTGDSIVVAPSQTLSDAEYNMLRDCAIRTVRHLGVVGECNIQYALNPNSMEYCIIEVNARLSRSSALASKATGYPLAFVAAQLALGKALPEIRNSITKETSACFEPSLDYIAVKIPRWDLKKFTRVSRLLGSAMKSVGEVMSIGRTFEEAIQKAIRMAQDNYVPGFVSGVVEYSDEAMSKPTEARLLAIADGFAKGITIEHIHDLTKIDCWFLQRLKAISNCESYMRTRNALSAQELLIAKQLGFSDKEIAQLIDDTEQGIRRQRVSRGIRPFVKQIDTVAAEFPAKTNYLYTTYSSVRIHDPDISPPAEDRQSLSSSLEKASTLSELVRNGPWQGQSDNPGYDDVEFNEFGIIVLGCGAYRIGSSVEFDCCAVSAIRTLREKGIRSVMINYNPETVSTDYDECDRLYFEELSLERVLDIYDREQASGVIVSMGGQLANNIAMPLHRQSVRILGTTPEMIDGAENRYKFSRMCDRIGVDQPRWKEVSSIADAKVFCEDVGYPVLVRPSYVLSGAAMNVAHKSEDLEAYLSEAALVSPDCPVVISKFILEAKEIEVDAVASKGELKMHVISEHIENAGVHSGDATLVLPPQDLDEITVRKVEEATAKVALALNVTGPMNIQFIAKNNEIKVIECNLRASRSFPFVSKTIGLDLAKFATKVILGAQVTSYPVDVRKIPFVGVKVALFSFTRLLGADPVLGVEMASTGEVACYGASREEAYLKGLLATSKPLPKKTVAISIGTYKEKLEFLASAKKLTDMGFKLIGTPGTADFFQEHGVNTEMAMWSTKGEYPESESQNTVEKMLRDGRIEFFINIPSNNSYRRLASFESPGYLSRRAAVDFSVPLLTNIKCAKLFVRTLELTQEKGYSLPLSACDARFSSRVITMPGLVLIETAMEENLTRSSHSKSKPAQTVSSISAEALRGGFAYVGLSFSSDVCQTPDRFSDLLQQARNEALCDFSVFATARPGNAAIVRSMAGSTGGLLVHPTKSDLKRNAGVDPWMAHLRSWPTESPIVLRASGASLAALLFVAVVCSREVHVTQVARKEDINLIRSAKGSGLQLTCDVNVLDLYATDSSSRIPQADQEALWESLEVIDAITGPPTMIVPLLLESVYKGVIDLAWVQSRLIEGPSRILGISKILPKSFVEIDMDTTWDGEAASDVAGVSCRGRVTRVVHNGNVAFLDGKIWTKSGSGRSLCCSGSSERTPGSSTAVGPIPLKTEEKSETLKWQRAVSSDSKNQALSQNIVTEAGIAVKTLKQSQGWEAMNGEVSGDNKSTILHSPQLAADVLPGYGSGWWAGRHVLSVGQFGRDELYKLFEVAQEMRTMVSRVGHYELLRGKVMACLFYEPSTRTCCSFQAAMQRLGGTVLSIQDVQSSSISKGESLGDTIRTLGCYSDLVVLRHPKVGAAQEAAAHSKFPVINAGDGIGEHPTQALLDVFTIREELGTVNGVTVTFVGDLKNGRTVHSLARVLGLYSVRVRYVSPESLRMPSEILEELANRGIDQTEHLELTDAIVRETDVLYVTRVQKERFAKMEDYEKAKDTYKICPKMLTRAKEQMIVMHPFPRLGELSPDLDTDPHAVYFRQMEYGMYVRMALLAMVLGKE